MSAAHHPGLVLDLALLLKNLILVRHGLPFQPPAGPVHGKLKPFFSGLSQLTGPPVAPPPKTEEPVHNAPSREKLPLHADNVALLHQAIGLP